jgi:hypothetical protein
MPMDSERGGSGTKALWIVIGAVVKRRYCPRKTQPERLPGGVWRLCEYSANAFMSHS